MSSLTYKEHCRGMEEWYFEKMKLLDRRIMEFDCCHMSNTKWRKLFSAIAQNADVCRDCEIFVFDLEKESRMRWTNIMRLDRAAEHHKYLFEDYICEGLAGGHDPVVYREIHYIEFRKRYGKRAEQDLQQIKKVIAALGQFHREESALCLRIFGYS